MTLVLWLFGSYLLGAIPTSFLVGTLCAGVDLRQRGSKNLGATNVYRVLGLKYAIPVALVDIAKGIIPVLVFARLAGSQAWIPPLMALAAVVGHVFSVFVRFRGGKGVATAAGAVLALEPVALGISVIAWVAVLLSTRFMSLASITGALTFPVVVWVRHPEHRGSVAAGVALAAFIVFNHRSNIRRLLTGTENRLGETAGDRVT